MNRSKLVGLALGFGVAASLVGVTTHAQRRGGRNAEAAAPAPRRARTNEPVAARCTALSALFVTDATAALTALGVTPPADFEARYRRELRNFDTACAALTPEQLSCVETAPNSIAGVGSCGVNEGKEYNSRVLPPLIASDYVTWQAHKHEARSEQTTREALAQLTGTWRLADQWSEQIFRVSADGAAHHEDRRNGSEPQIHEGTIDVLSPTHIQARMGYATFNWGFFVDGDRVLFSNQTATSAYPIAATGTTRMGFNGQFFLIDNIRATPTCKAYAGRFDPMEVTCAWEGEGDARKLVITRAAAKSVESGTNLPAYPMRFVERRGHLIPDGNAMFWARAPQP